ncbi:hypothetical protein B0H14DRAFT_3435161 [Mycena olivaceomarginata]|nr:hypothetical protein B0H14DRAFT_3435161 [Mycena olivaceomarginata]
MPPQAFTQTSGFSAPPPFQPDFSFHNTFQATFNGSAPAAASASTMRAPLGDATNMANLDARGKRKRSGNQNGSRKRRHINATDADTPAVFGVGPSSATAGAAAAASQTVRDVDQTARQDGIFALGMSLLLARKMEYLEEC